MQRMRLSIETEIDPDQGSATFDFIAEDHELREMVRYGISSEVGQEIVDRLGVVVADIVHGGRSVRERLSPSVLAGEARHIREPRAPAPLD